jgi:glycine/D-amino acid oxidase-like deaminating enzyme
MGPKIAIIGGGIGGLTAAVALARKGLAAEVYEQAPALEEVAAGVGPWPNAMTALEPIGLSGKVARLAAKVSRQGRPCQGSRGARLAVPSYLLIHTDTCAGARARSMTVARSLASGSRVTSKASYGDRDVKRASIDLDLDALAVPDPVPGGWDNGAAVTRICKHDTGQVAQDVRDRDGHLAHRDPRAWASAGGTELRRYRC